MLGVSLCGLASQASAGRFEPPCVDDPNDVLIIGDSYVNFDIAHTFPDDMARVAGARWPLFAVPGAAMATGGIAGYIPDQFEVASWFHPDAKVVLMDGGGNDILIPSLFWVGGGHCKNSQHADELLVCQWIVAAAIERAEQLMMRMADQGIRDVLYFFYPHIPGGLLGGANPNVILDYALPEVREVCRSAYAMTGGRLRCTFLDLVPVFEGESDVFAADGVHPNSNGSLLTARAVWTKMRNRCIAQPSSRGCCVP